MSKRITATLLATALLLSLASCSNEPQKTSETETVPTTEVTTILTEQAAEPESWLGKWEADDTEEYMEIHDVTAKGFSVDFYHFEEGLLEKFNYDMEFDDSANKVASQIGSADDNGGWEYTFILGDGYITVQSKLPEQKYIKAA